MKKAAVIGHFAFGKEFLDGQTIKTKVLAKALCEHFGEESILKVDTHGWSANPVKFTAQIWNAAMKAESVVILPAHNGLQVIVPLLCVAQKIYKNKLHYAVIGGWLPTFLRKRKWLGKLLKAFKGIYVETQVMKLQLEEQGFSNIVIMPNCKDLPVLSSEELEKDYQEPYKLCTFSRVMREKGIEDAVYAVSAVNEKMGRTVYALDIYGQVDSEQREWFEEVQEQFPDYIRYCGGIPFDKSVSVLRNYFALLFPTRFYTEGVPGTIIDAYAAGVPVIASRWESFYEVIEDSYTGIGVDFGQVESLCKRLEEIAEAPEVLMRLKRNCLQRAVSYIPENAVRVLVNKLEGK